MNNKKKIKKCKCEHLCVDCRYYQEPTCYFSIVNPATCSIHTKAKISCVDGKKEIYYLLCEDCNTNGKCKKYKPLKYVELKNWLRAQPSDSFCRSTIEKKLGEDLLHVLEGGESEFLESVYTGDSPYEHEIIVTKKAIEDSLRKRGYNLESAKMVEHGGCYTPKLSDEEYNKKKSWIENIKKLLGDN